MSDGAGCGEQESFEIPWKISPLPIRLRFMNSLMILTAVDEGGSTSGSVINIAAKCHTAVSVK